MQGNREQDVFFRLLKLHRDGTVAEVRYYDTYSHRPTDEWGGDGSPPGSPVATAFYSALLEQHRYWEATLATEGVLQLDLPSRSDTDGKRLSDQTTHSLVRDMITRADFFPQYGVQPHSYGMQAGNGFQDTFTGSLAMALEMGAFDYATGVLDNYLQHYVRADGTVRYRGPELAQDGRMLTLIALYASYTGDPQRLLRKYHSKIEAIITLLRALRSKALSLPADSPAYGMPSANDEADSWRESTACGATFGNASAAHGCVTGQPFISIAAEMERGFVEMARVWAASGNATLSAEAGRLEKEAAELHADFLVSLRRSTLPPDPASGNVTCHPHIAGWTSCVWKGGHAHGPNITNLSPFGTNCRTWSEVLYAGVLPPSTAVEIVDLVAQSYSMLGHPSGYGPGGGTFCSFVEYGWGAGLLQHDLIDRFLLFYYTMSAHGMTRGTWTAPECSVCDRGKKSSGYAAPSQALLPTLTKWLMVYEDPATQTLWLGKALPRVWLDGDSVGIARAPTRGGRVSFTLNGSSAAIVANVTLPAGFAWPLGGIKLRLRVPGFPARWIASATVGGKPWPVNATEETLSFATRPADVVVLQSVRVTLGTN